MIHIVFNEADVEVLQKAIELDASMQGEVIQIYDALKPSELQDMTEKIKNLLR